MHFFRHAGPEEPAPYLIRGHPDVVPTKVGNHLKDWVPVFTGNPGFRLSPERRLSLNQAIYGETLFNIGLNLWVSTYRELIRGGLLWDFSKRFGVPVGGSYLQALLSGYLRLFYSTGAIQPTWGSAWPAWRGTSLGLWGFIGLRWCNISGLRSLDLSLVR